MSIQLEQDSISPQLLQAIEMASKLPKDELAQFILEEIANRKWEKESSELFVNILNSRAETAGGKSMTLKKYIQQQRGKS